MKLGGQPSQPHVPGPDGRVTMHPALPAAKRLINFRFLTVLFLYGLRGIHLP